ncbi:helix-turn-helix domain-containing protein [Mammaliicoccus sciuri]|uniref:hypothetical protein n=1 Tax=Mammaliicoccus sciuri TaxID=1296 RepID=UPI0021D10922|nr:hypothetical protein [Mammaliicoccus sciuri]UXV32868.1 hypothetical protein MUA60_03545 [Mammaliicoccus sciuri]
MGSVHLHDLNYYKKERLKQDERKIIIIVDTRHKNKISQLINQIEMDLQHNLNEIYPDLNMDCFVDYAIEVNRVMSDIHFNINHQYKINID